MNQTQTRSPRKRWLSLLLAVILMIGLLPISAFASNDAYSLSASSRFFIVSESDPTDTDLGNFVQLIDQEFAAKNKPSSAPLAIVYGQEKDAENGDIVVKVDSSLAAQSYKISVGQKIVVTGGDAAGAFYGLTNLLQMVEKGSLQDVSNSPLVEERSAYIDCGRVYFSPDMIKALIKTLAWNRMNTLYLDFSNNNATRFFLDEMKVTAGGQNYDITTAKPSDGKYLTQADMVDIIKVAKQYGVQIIPTFNSPGHIGGLYSLNKDLFDKGTATDYDSNCGKVTLLIENKNAYDFGQAVVKLYVDFFAQQGCESFNIAADEAALGNVKYDSDNETFVKYVNELNTYIKSKNMTTRMFNDGIQSVNSNISKDIIVLYWAPESTAEALHKQGYQVVNFSYGAGLYFAYGASWWVWNQPVSTIYDGWTAGVLNRNTGDQYQYNYVATEQTDPSNLLGATFAVWTDYAFTQSVSGDQIINRDSENVVEKIQVVGDRCWSNKSSETYANWKAGLTTAPGGINVSTYAIDGTVLPAASGITAASQVEIPVEDANNTGVSVVVKGEKGQTGSLTVDKLETSTNAEAITAAGAEKSVSYNVTPAVDGKAYTGEGTVTLPVPEGWATEASRIRAYIIDNGAVKLISGTLSDGKYTFQVPHFSEMGLVQLAEGAGSTKMVTVAVGRTVKETLQGNQTTISGDSNYSEYVTVQAEHKTTTDGNKLLEITSANDLVSGAQYLIANQRMGVANHDNQLLTTGRTSWGDNKVLALSGTPSTDSTAALWTITETNGGYTLKNGLSYLNIGNLTASASTTSKSLALACQDNNGTTGYPDKYWNISYSERGTTYYLNALGGQAGAGGWAGNQSENAATDIGSRWTIYRIVDEGATDTTTVSFTGKKVGGPVTVTVGDTTYSVTVVEKQNVEIPISIIDYRADGLLFDFQVGGKTYDYGLVHSHNNDGNVSSVNGGTLPGESYGTRIAGTTLENTGYDASDSFSGNYYFWGNKWSRSGMVESELGSNGMPVYTNATVARVAQELAAGNYNSDEMAGVVNDNDVIYDTFLKPGAARSVVGKDAEKMSTTFASAKTWSNITNAYDLAWYLLNTLYQADTNTTEVTGTDKQTYQVPIYGMGVDAYDRLILTEKDGIYSFDAANEKNNYDTESRSIYEDDTASSLQFYPIDGLGYDAILGDTTDKTDSPHEKDKYGNITATVRPEHPNGSYTLRGEAQFVYQDNLYFEFSGDDDVYMYINGVLALDLGGAHGICTKRVNLKDVATKCHLTPGEVATFTFFYMERNSDASNFKIETNMELVQRDIAVQKKAYDTNYANEIPSNMSVPTGTTVAYDLILTNKSNSVMNQIKFTDTDDCEATVSFGYGVKAPQIAAGTVRKENGSVTLGELNSYVIYITEGDNENEKEVANTRKTLASLDALSKAVAETKLLPGQSLHVRFLTATFDVNSSTILSYRNTVAATASVGGTSLSDTASHELYSYNANDTGRTYVVDFGLPLKITKIFSVAPSNIGDVQLSSSNTLKYGTVILTGTGANVELVYTRTADKTIDNAETIVLDVVYKMGNSNVSLQKTLTIIPASNVYYEDSLAAFTNGKGAAENATWSTVDNDDQTTTKGGGTDVYQALEELGKSGVYGYDKQYNSSSMLSMGTAHKVTVTSEMLKNWKDHADSAWPTASFTFTGTGFDVISLTNNKSGAIFVDVYAGSKAEGKAEKKYVVNNYYGYTYNKDTKTWEVTPNVDNTLYQIPVMKITDLAYGEHTVVIKVAYSEYFDTANKSEYSFWLDAIRVYNPMGKDYDYTADNEGYPQYIKLRDELAKTAETNKGVVFIDGAANASIADYANFGPNNEVYLANGQAISFKVPEDDKIASIQIGAKAPDGKSASMVVNDNDESARTLNTATEMYYEISKTGNQFTIANKGEGILSLTNLKITYTDKNHEEVKLESLTAEEQANAVAMVQALFAAPVEAFQPETFQASWGRAVRAGKRATLTVKTSADVESITVDGQPITSYTTRTERTGWGWWSPKVTYHVFTYTITAPAQTTDYAVCAVNAEGTASEPITATLTVRPATWWNWWF